MTLTFNREHWYTFLVYPGANYVEKGGLVLAVVWTNGDAASFIAPEGEDYEKIILEK